VGRGSVASQVRKTIPDDQPNYTVKAAAKRALCSTRTIERWLHKGMKAKVYRGIIIIDHDELIGFSLKMARLNPINRTKFDTPEAD
jgi:hypothetical protein